MKPDGDEDTLAEFFDIAGNLHRLRILLYLTEAEEHFVCGLSNLVDMSNSSLKQYEVARHT